MVRLKYRDAPFFLQVGGVAAQFSYGAIANAKAQFPDSGLNIFGLGVGADIRESPTITYSPLQGEKYTQRLLSKISLKTIFLLYHSGWTIERVLRVCLERLGDVKNAPGASGPTPDYPPEFSLFKNLMKRFRAFQRADGLELIFDKDGETLLMRVDSERVSNNDLIAVNRALNLPVETVDFSFTELPKNRYQLKIETRSLLGILYYLSHSVDTPLTDKKLGWVTIVKDGDGGVFDWSQVTGDLLQINSSAEKPDNKSVSINYRDHWFYIKDDDLGSKSTFSLLAQIFALQEGRVEVNEPVLTLPVGN